MILKLLQNLRDKANKLVVSRQKTNNFVNLKPTLLLFIFITLTNSICGQTIYYSQSSGDPTLNTNWNTSRTGEGASPLGFTTNNQHFVIQNGHIMTTVTPWSISGGSGVLLMIEDGATLKSDVAITFTSTPTFKIENGGTYIHNFDTQFANSSIFNGIEQFSINSNIIINKWHGTGSVATGITLPFGNLIIDLSNYSSNWQWSLSSGMLCTGNLEIKSTSSGSIRFTSGITSEISIGGNFSISNGVLDMSSGTAQPIVNINGNFIISGGTITESSSGNGSFIFAKNGTQTFSKSGGIISEFIHLKVNNGSTLEMGSSIFSGKGTITVANGGTLKIGSLNPSGAIAGNITAIGGLILDAGSTVEFNGLATQIMASRTFSNLSINNPSGVTLLSDAQVSCNDLIVLPTASFTINSDAANSGSLIINGTSTGNITYNRYLTKDKWHLISAPVSTQNIQAFATNVSNNIAISPTYKYSVSPYDNTGIKGSTTWNYWTTGAGTNPFTGAESFSSGKGYQILTNTSEGTVSFTGTTPVSTVSLPVTVGTTNGTNGWNLVGNPYPASIPANSNAHATNNFITLNSSALDPSYAAIYVWDPIAAAYNIINNGNAAKHLAPGQGFFVKSVSGGGTVNFLPAMRNHTASTFHRIAIDETPSITIIAETGTAKSSSTNLKYFDQASLGLDPGYDAGRFGAANSSFEIYTKLVEDNGVDFALQALPNNAYETTVVPIGLEASSGTQLTFKANYTNLPLDTKVFIEDRLLGSFTELNNTDKTYSIALAEPSIGVGRFYLRTSGPQGTLSTLKEASVKMKVIPLYATNQIKVIGQIEQPATIELYDMQGRKLLKTPLINNEMIIPNVKKGVYVVKVISAQQHYSTKIIWTPIN